MSRNKTFTEKREWGQGQVQVIGEGIQCQKGHTILKWSPTDWRSQREISTTHIPRICELSCQGRSRSHGSWPSSTHMLKAGPQESWDPWNQLPRGYPYLSFTLYPEQFGMPLHTHTTYPAFPSSCLGMHRNMVLLGPTGHLFLKTWEKGHGDSSR